MSASQKEHKSEYKVFPQALSLLQAFQKKYAHIKAPVKPKMLEEKSKPKQIEEQEKKDEKGQLKKAPYKPISFQDLAWQEHQGLRAKTNPPKVSPNKKTLSKEEAKKIIGNFLRDRWEDLRKTGRPVLTRTGKKHTDIFKYFLHDEPVKKSLHPEKLMTLRKALAGGDWNANIFKDQFLPQLTLSLFADRKITPWQAFSVLDRAQVQREFSLLNTYRIVDSNGEFSQYAKEILIPAIQNQNVLRPLSQKELKLFREVVFHLPLSEQYFYTTDLGRYNPLRLEYQLIKFRNEPSAIDIQNMSTGQILFYFEEAELKYVIKKPTGEIVRDKIICGKGPANLNEKSFTAFKQSDLGALTFPQFSYQYHDFFEITRLRGHTLLTLKEGFFSLLMQSDAIVPAYGKISTRTLVHLNFGAYDALGLCRFGLQHYIRTIPQLGLQTNTDTEGSVRQKLRLLALYYPGCRSFNSIHGNTQISYLEATAHDRYHSNVMSTILENILEVLLRFVDLTRQFGFAWSKEIYTWIDCELNYFFTNHYNLEKLMTDTTVAFCDFLMHEMPVTKYRTGGLIIFNGKITFPGVIIFLDMLDNPEKWKKLQINPEKLSPPLLNFYLQIKRIYPSIKKDNFKIRFMKCYSYLELESNNKAGNISAFFEIIERNKLALENDFSFIKISKEQAVNNPDCRNMIMGRLNSKGPATTLIEIILFYEYERSLKHLSAYSTNQFSSFVKAILVDNYSVDKALSFTQRRLNGVGEDMARLEVGWASIFSPSSLKIVQPKAGGGALTDAKAEKLLVKIPSNSGP